MGGQDAIDKIERSLRILRFGVIGIFLIALVGLLYFAKDFLLPVLLAFLFALTLSPIVRSCSGAALPQCSVRWSLSFCFSARFHQPLICLAGRYRMDCAAPDISRKAEQKLAALRTPVEAVVEATEQVETITEGTSSDNVQKVVVEQPGLYQKPPTLFLAA